MARYTELLVSYRLSVTTVMTMDKLHRTIISCMETIISCMETTVELWKNYSSSVQTVNVSMASMATMGHCSTVTDCGRRPRICWCKDQGMIQFSSASRLIIQNTSEDSDKKADKKSKALIKLVCCQLMCCLTSCFIVFIHGPVGAG